MKFFKIVDKIIKENKDNTIVRKNGTLLIEPLGIPKSRHMIFKPIGDRAVKEIFIGDYKNEFPKEYIKLLKKYNGLSIYNHKIVLLNSIDKRTKKPMEFAGHGLTLFGLPCRPPFERPRDEEECYDIRIEDLRKHDNIPDTYLKIGVYRRCDEWNSTTEIMVDTVSHRVYAFEREDDKIQAEWDNLDDCLCDIYEKVSKMPLVAEKYSKSIWSKQ